MCLNDNECDGYSYTIKYSKCYLYTTCIDCILQLCQFPFDCQTKNKGRVGDIFAYTYRENRNDDDSGCFLKERGNSRLIDNLKWVNGVFPYKILC